MSDLAWRRQARRLDGLFWAEVATEPPFGPLRGATPAQKSGLAFERLCRRKLQAFEPSQPWLKFEDNSGIGYACPDIVLARRGLVIECKLSDVDGAEAQLKWLYLPLLRWIWPETKWRGLVLVKNWRGAARPLIYGLAQARDEISFMLGEQNLLL